MKSKIVPALPTERAQYERWYQIGLEAMTAASATLGTLPQLPAMSWVPTFTIICAATNPQARVAAIEKAARQLTVVPNRITINDHQVRLTFSLALAGNWVITDGAFWRLYDGLLSNLIGSVFQPVVAIKIALNGHETAPVTPQRPHFHAYGATTEKPLEVTLQPASVTVASCTGTQGSSPTSKVYRLSHYYKD